MKKILTLILICSTLISKADSWTQKANFGGGKRAFAFSFSIGNLGYVGAGIDSFNNFFKDFWEYDPSSNTWTQKADCGTIGRILGTGFSILNKGYAGLGATSGPSQDFFEYDPATNMWTPKSNFPGLGVVAATSFSSASKGYVCTGIDDIFTSSNTFKDLWEYDPILDIWIQKTDFAGLKRCFASGFFIGGKGYLGLGGDALGTLFQDFWEYDPQLDSWTQIANFPGTPRAESAAFSICDKGYIGTGQDITDYDVLDFWEYSSITNTWTQKADFGGGTRNDCAFFSIGSKGFGGIGERDGPSGLTNVFNDFWEYTPDSACATGIEELSTSNLEFSLSPNPVKDFLIINSPLNGKEKINLAITDVNGKKVFESQLSHSTISLKELPKGIYFVEVSNGKQNAVRKFVKE